MSEDAIRPNQKGKMIYDSRLLEDLRRVPLYIQLLYGINGVIGGFFLFTSNLFFTISETPEPWVLASGAISLGAFYFASRWYRNQFGSMKPLQGEREKSTRLGILFSLSLLVAIVLDIKQATPISLTGIGFVFVFIFRYVQLRKLSGYPGKNNYFNLMLIAGGILAVLFANTLGFSGAYGMKNFPIMIFGIQLMVAGIVDYITFLSKFPPASDTYE